MYIVYGKPGCTFCTRALALLKASNLESTYIDVSQDQDAYKKLVDSGFRTVPQIYLGDAHIGGFDKLQEHIKSA